MKKGEITGLRWKDIDSISLDIDNSRLFLITCFFTLTAEAVVDKPASAMPVKFYY
ncbi:hypothetical protein NGI46_26925 [Peribacillus butanolivorans]|nr:hypothetical protein [Peribacillus butanolivorans]